jgi:hypothetical protein
LAQALVLGLHVVELVGEGVSIGTEHGTSIAPRPGSAGQSDKRDETARCERNFEPRGRQEERGEGKGHPGFPLSSLVSWRSQSLSRPLPANPSSRRAKRTLNVVSVP